MQVLMPPAKFRFTEADDVKAYGDGWFTWSEKELAGLRGRNLIALEEAVDLPIQQVINGTRYGETLATMAAMWITLHREGHEVAWKDFDPAVLLTEWKWDVAAPLGKDPASGEPEKTDSNSSPEPTGESATSS